MMSSKGRKGRGTNKEYILLEYREVQSRAIKIEEKMKNFLDVDRWAAKYKSLCDGRYLFFSLVTGKGHSHVYKDDAVVLAGGTDNTYAIPAYIK
jgi:hypothetical protein